MTNDELYAMKEEIAKASRELDYAMSDYRTHPTEENSKAYSDAYGIYKDLMERWMETTIAQHDD